MLKISNLTNEPLKWVQPVMRQEYELRFGGSLVAVLNFRNAWSNKAIAKSGDGSWVFQRVGFWQDRAVIQEKGSAYDLAEFSRTSWKRTGTLAFSHGRLFKATTNMWLTQMVWSGENGVPLIRFDHISGFFKRKADVEILSTAKNLPELPLLVLFGWYQILILIREAAAASS